MRDRDSIIRISITIEMAQNLLANKYTSRDVKQVINSLVVGRQLSNEESEIISDIFGFRGTDNSMYFSKDNAKEIAGALLLLTGGAVPVGEEIISKLSETLRAVDGLEVNHQISVAASRFVKRLFELRYGMMYINYSTPLMSTVNNKQLDIDAEINKRIGVLKGIGITGNSVRLLRLIYKVSKSSTTISKQSYNKTIDIEQSIFQLPHSSGKVALRVIRANGNELYELFDAPDTLKLSDMYFKSYEIEQHYSEESILSLIDVIRQRKDIAVTLENQLSASGKGSVSADFRTDAFLMINHSQHIKIYDLYGEALNRAFTDYICHVNHTNRFRVAYRAVVDGKTVYLSLNDKYQKVIDELKKIIEIRKVYGGTASNTLRVRLYSFKDSTLPIAKELSSKQLSERLSKYGVSYLNNLLNNYEKHLRELTGIKIWYNELFIVEDFKLDAYIRTPEEVFIKVYYLNKDSNKIEFTPNFMSYIKGKTKEEAGEIVYRLPTSRNYRNGETSYVEVNEKYGKAIARIRLILGTNNIGNNVGSLIKAYDTSKISNSVFDVYASYGIPMSYKEPSSEELVNLYKQYGLKFMRDLEKAYKIELAKLPASTFGDFTNINVLGSPFALEGYIQYRVVTRKEYDACRGNTEVSEKKRVKLVSDDDIAQGKIPKIGDAVFKLLASWKDLDNPRILFDGTDVYGRRKMVDIREKYSRTLGNIAHIISKALVGLPM